VVTVAAYGGGVNSTAMLVLLAKQDFRPDLILFADTGGERPDTYAFILRFNRWLIANNMPEIITVKKGGIQETLEENCIRMNMLPSIAYGYKTCSHKYKIEPQNKYVNNWEPARKAWASGSKVTKLIGYDADEHHRAKIPEDDKYVMRYPLVEQDIGREECKQIITDAGLCLPGKSACFFCPSSKKHEIRQLAREYPELLQRALVMEANAHLTSVKGLGRKFAWRDLLTQQEFQPDDFGTPEVPCGCYDG
jgi:hypothetical protein